MRLAPLLLYLFDLANLIIPKIRCYFYVKAPIKCIFYQINQASARIILVGKLSYLSKVFDTKYGKGSIEYIVKVFRYYSEKNCTENN